MGVEHAIGFAGDGRAFDIRNGDGARSFGFGFALRRSGVGSLAGLSNNDRQLAASDERIAVLEFAGVVDIDGKLHQLLDHVLPGHARVTTGARSDNVYALEIAKFFSADADIVQSHNAFLQRDARLQWCRANPAAVRRSPSACSAENHPCRIMLSSFKITAACITRPRQNGGTHLSFRAENDQIGGVRLP